MRGERRRREKGDRGWIDGSEGRRKRRKGERREDVGRRERGSWEGIRGRRKTDGV